MMETNMDVASFFSKEEWENISEYVRLRYKNMLENYMKMCEAGLTPVKPDFMSRNLPQQRNKRSYCDMEHRSESVKKYAVEVTSSAAELSAAVKSALPQVINGYSEVTSIPNGTIEEPTEDFLGFTAKEIRVKPIGYKMLLQIIKKLEKEIEELESEGAESKNKESRRYPRRSIPYKNYTEEDVPNDDDYIFCDECDKEWEGDCPFHGPLIIVEDKKVPPNPNDPTRAERTLPSMLVIAQSAIPNAGKGVWTREPLMKGIRFGPYEGTITDASNNNGYCWQVRHNRRTLYCIDAYPKGTSNWMRYVNCARHVDEQNLIAFQYKGKIYYRTLCDIAAHVELLVWYGEEFGRELGIDLASFQKPQHKCLKGAALACSICAVSFSNSFFLQKHTRNSYCKKNYICCKQSSEPDEGMKSPVERQSDTSDSADVEDTPVFEINCALNTSTYKVASEAEKSSLSQRKVCIVEKCVRQVVCNCLDKTCPESGDSCGYKHNQGRSSTTHKSIPAGEKRYTCAVCGKNFTTNASLTRHRSMHTMEKPYFCDVCEYRCTTSSNLTRNRRIHSGEKPYFCDVCEYRCTTSSKLKQHSRIHSGEKPYVCDVCDYKCTQSGTLTRHKKIHSGEKPYVCDVCDYRCNEFSNLKKHNRIHSGEKPYVCDVCDYRCTTSSSLKQHSRIHSGEKPYVCDVCDYRCTTSSSLKQHSRIHSGEKPYVCDVCDYRCTTSSYLKQHSRIHSGEKPYVCDVCDYRCNRSSNLKQHSRIHSGEKPYVCDVCDYRCNRSSNLKQHSRIHSGEKPYVCDVCDYWCNQSSDLKKHSKIH